MIVQMGLVIAWIIITRHHSVNGLSQWETLHRNVVSHWLRLLPEWSLVTRRYTQLGHYKGSIWNTLWTHNRELISNHAGKLWVGCVCFLENQPRYNGTEMYKLVRHDYELTLWVPGLWKLTLLSLDQEIWWLYLQELNCKSSDIRFIIVHGLQEGHTTPISFLKKTS